MSIVDLGKKTKSAEKRKERKEKEAGTQRKRKEKEEKEKGKGKTADMDTKRKRDADDEEEKPNENKKKQKLKENSGEQEKEERKEYGKEKKKKKEGKEKQEKKGKKEKKDKKDKKNKKEQADSTISSAETGASNPSVVTAIGNYIEQPHLLAVPQSTIDAFCKEHNIDVTTNRPLRPILEFSQAGFTPDLLKSVKDFTKPTPIQSVCWPHILSGKDLTGIAETGSGKTLAFTLPALTHIMSQRASNPRHKGPTVLVVAPTRELAMQSQEQAESAGAEARVRSVCVYGGVPKDAQKKALRSGVDIVVATPGRLLDLIEEGACDITGVSYLVLDEADRMLDIGFEQAVRSIIKQTRPDRQTLMFSATWPESVRKLAMDFQREPVKVTIGSPDLSASQNVTQVVEVLANPNDKEGKLVQLLEKYHKSRKNRVLVFALYKKEATRVESLLSRKGYRVVAIHGDKNQYQRTEALGQFKDGSFPLMIATDVAARGLDIPDVEVVINLTFPLTIEDYVHRIGRTGRGGKKGISHTLFTQHDKAHSGELINVLKQANQNVPEELLKFGGTVKKKEHSAYGAFFKEMDITVKPTKIVFSDD
ncbi:ATP-dependent RNA helicase dbp3 [Endogone sp. FLAS-F59071]|nr:ATP-dependent RNA helicase dbp3 [Endogone sp. FLAS-F59071]|eukprot:RUS21617.1 ATP-dependent RNA helicase dbp3 [Endogone sp. FLAS-F59071]